MRRNLTGVVFTSIALFLFLIGPVSYANPISESSANAQLQSAGVSPEQTADWAPHFDRGICPDENGNPDVDMTLSINEALTWIHYGFTYSDAQTIASALCNDVQIERDYTEDHQLIYVDIDNHEKRAADDAEDWKKAGFSASEIVEYLQQNISLEDALHERQRASQRANSKRQFEAAWAASSLPKDKKADWMKAGFSPDDASKWINAGQAVTSAIQLSKQEGISANDAAAYAQAIRGQCPGNTVYTTDPATQNPYATKGKCFFIKARIQQLLGATKARAESIESEEGQNVTPLIIDYMDRPTPAVGHIASGIFLISDVQQYQGGLGTLQTAAVAKLVYERH